MPKNSPSASERHTSRLAGYVTKEEGIWQTFTTAVQVAVVATHTGMLPGRAGQADFLGDSEVQILILSDSNLPKLVSTFRGLKDHLFHQFIYGA